MPVVYKGIKLDCGYRIDVLVNDLVIIELKTVEKYGSSDFHVGGMSSSMDNYAD